MTTFYYHGNVHLQFKVINATCKSQRVVFFNYLIHSNQIVTAVNKHFEKQASTPYYLEEK